MYFYISGIVSGFGAFAIQRDNLAIHFGLIFFLKSMIE
jgi:hypothetical protein